MHFVYILQLSGGKNKYYIGETNKLKQRIINHQKGLSKYTKKYLPVKLKYFEGYEYESTAKDREKQLKNYGSSYYGIIKRVNKSMGL